VSCTPSNIILLEVGNRGRRLPDVDSKNRREMSLFQWLVGLAMPCIRCDVVARASEVDNWVFASEGQQGHRHKNPASSYGD
jgi:hypothetical protein